MLALGHKFEVIENSFDGLTPRMRLIATLRNRQLGLWAAHMMEFELAQAEEYADGIVVLGLQSDGDLAIVDKLVEDFARAGMTVPTEVICYEMAQRTLSAEAQLSRSSDLPEAA